VARRRRRRRPESTVRPMMVAERGRLQQQQQRRRRDWMRLARRVTLAGLVTLALLAQPTSGRGGGELAAAADRKSRKRHPAVAVDELAPLSTVDDDPYEQDSAETYRNATADRRTAVTSGRRHFDFVNPKPGKRG